MAIKGDLAKILSGMPIQIPQCNIAIAQPDIRSIAAFGEDDFLAAIQLFTNIERVVEPVKQGNSRLGLLSDFQVLIVILQQDNETQKVVNDFFSLIFPDYDFEIQPGSINFKIKESNRIIGQFNPMNFQNFQEILSLLFLPRGAEEQIDYNPANDAARAIAEKLKEGQRIRQKLAAEKAEVPQSLLANYASVLSIGLGMSIATLYTYTPFQLYDAFLRYQTKISFDLYQKVATTPMMDVSKMKEPPHWMDNIYK